MTIRKNRHIGDRVRVASNEWSLSELVVEYVERTVSKPLSRADFLRELIKLAGKRPIAKAANRRLDIALLKHQPAHDLRAGHAVWR